MWKVKCVQDIKNLSEHREVPKEVIEKVYSELLTIKAWSDEMNEVTIEDFNTDYFGYGYIVILDGSESEEEIRALGLTEGLEGVIPECAESYYFNDEKWTKIVVVYNDSYSMSFWLKNSNLFKDYEDDSRSRFVAEVSKLKEPF